MFTKLEISALLVLLALVFQTHDDVRKLTTPPVKQELAALLAQYPDPVQLDSRTKVAQCQVQGPLPDHACTPGAVFTQATPTQICVPGYTKTVRSVSAKTKQQLYAAYGLAYPQTRGAYEADHLIPLELGGSNEIANLFPEAANPEPGFHQKDLVENYLHNEMCAGRISLGAAQAQIANDWLSVYHALTPSQIQSLLKQFVSYN